MAYAYKYRGYYSNCTKKVKEMETLCSNVVNH